jgi:hypothetical protein
VAKGLAKEELDSEKWLVLVARLAKLSYAQVRVMILEFLDTDIFHVSVECCTSFIEPLIESWNIDLEIFAVEISLNRRLTRAGYLKRFEFVEMESETVPEVQPGFAEFLQDASLSGDSTAEELDFLKSLKLAGRRPGPLYYYRALQTLRDPVHFRPPLKESQLAQVPVRRKGTR